jgi:hypothetical protein
MKNDPIADEVRAARDTLARRHDYDLDAICDALRAAAKSSGEPRIVLTPRREAPATVSAAQPAVAPARWADTTRRASGWMPGRRLPSATKENLR